MEDGFTVLKPVFDACDFNKDGYVKIHDLVKLGQQHTGSGGNGEVFVIKKIVNLIRPMKLDL